ncbi:MAG TPA: hypothetical protein VNJ04_14020 [Gemmatimonadaceae bacterium]|nr:hypothetical protein [Gemmatimonadaceae bacterium]
MALIDRLKQELDRAGKAAQDAFDDGKTRLEAFRTRQLADKAAEALGYAVFRAKKGGSELDSATFDRLRATLDTHDVEAGRLEAEIELRRQEMRAANAASRAEASVTTTTSSTTTGTTPGSGEKPFQGSPS